MPRTTLIDHWENIAIIVRQSAGRIMRVLAIVGTISLIRTGNAATVMQRARRVSSIQKPAIVTTSLVKIKIL